jgi:hypothetical protein
MLQFTVKSQPHEPEALVLKTLLVTASQVGAAAAEEVVLGVVVLGVVVMMIGVVVVGWIVMVVTPVVGAEVVVVQLEVELTG